MSCRAFGPNCPTRARPRRPQPRPASVALRGAVDRLGGRAPRRAILCHDGRGATNMSHHEHDDTCGHEAESGGGPDTGFLDFELHKVMYDEAESIVREAYRELLKDAVKQHLSKTWGARITALAQLAADE